MDTIKRRVGRPKGSPQTGPVVLSERRNRTRIEIQLGADAAEDLAEYVRWVEMSEGMSTADATAATVEFALRTIFKRDRLWQEWRRKGERDQAPASSTARPTPPAGTTSSPPAPTVARGSTGTSPAPSR